MKREKGWEEERRERKGKTMDKRVQYVKMKLIAPLLFAAEKAFFDFLSSLCPSDFLFSEWSIGCSLISYIPIQNTVEVNEEQIWPSEFGPRRTASNVGISMVKS